MDTTEGPPAGATREAIPHWRAALLAGEPCAYTNDQLIAELNAAFAAPVLTPRRLRNWTELGLVPKPARRVPPAAADGIPRALSPWWTVHVLTDLLTERARGTKLARLRATAAERLARWEREAGRDVDPAAGAALARPAPPAIPVVLQRAVQAYVARYSAAAPGGLPAGVRAELVLTDGHDFQETIPIPAPGRHAGRGADPNERAVGVRTCPGRLVPYGVIAPLRDSSLALVAQECQCRAADRPDREY